MSTAPPDSIPASKPPARKRGAPYGPGLTPGVLIIAALAFLLLMASGSMVFVQTLQSTAAELDQWPVARRHLGPLPGAPGSPSATGDPSGAIAGDRPQANLPGGPMTVRTDPWLKYFPEVEASMGHPPQMTPEQMHKLLFETSRVGSWGWALLDPASPFKTLYPDSPHMARMRERVLAYEAWKAAGSPDGPSDLGFTPLEEKQTQQVYDAWEKKYKESQKQQAASAKDKKTDKAK